MDLEAVSRTAIGVARIRARESARDDRLFVDPYAATVAAAFPSPPDAGPSDARRALAMQVVLRTRFYDDWLLTTVGDAAAQVVILGAGLDTRALRLPWPAGTTVFEVDLPAVLEVKNALLAGAEPRADNVTRTTVAADLTGDWLPPLVAAGFAIERATVWLAEGLLVYLDREQAAALLEVATSASVDGSALATERTASDHSRVIAADTSAATSLWRGGLGTGVENWLTEHGWRTDVHPLHDVAARLGRPMSRESESGFVTASR